MERLCFEKDGVDLGDAQKTLFLPLWGRACEARKTRPLLVDKAALEIIDKVDFDFSTMAAGGFVRLSIGILSPSGILWCRVLWIAAHVTKARWGRPAFAT